MDSIMGEPGTQALPKPATMVPEAAKKRKEIYEFIDDNDMTNLFLIALSEMQQEDPEKKKNKNEDWWTYYSLAGFCHRVLWLKHGLTRRRHPWITR